jgi:hypothetical protein
MVIVRATNKIILAYDEIARGWTTVAGILAHVRPDDVERATVDAQGIITDAVAKVSFLTKPSIVADVAKQTLTAEGVPVWLKDQLTTATRETVMAYCKYAFVVIGYSRAMACDDDPAQLRAYLRDRLPEKFGDLSIKDMQRAIDEAESSEQPVLSDAASWLKYSANKETLRQLNNKSEDALEAILNPLAEPEREEEEEERESEIVLELPPSPRDVVVGLPPLTSAEWLSLGGLRVNKQGRDAYINSALGEARLVRIRGAYRVSKASARDVIVRIYEESINEPALLLPLRILHENLAFVPDPPAPIVEADDDIAPIHGTRNRRRERKAAMLRETVKLALSPPTQKRQ